MFSVLNYPMGVIPAEELESKMPSRSCLGFEYWVLVLVCILVISRVFDNTVDGIMRVENPFNIGASWEQYFVHPDMASGKPYLYDRMSKLVNSKGRRL